MKLKRIKGKGQDIKNSNHLLLPMLFISLFVLLYFSRLLSLSLSFSLSFSFNSCLVSFCTFSSLTFKQSNIYSLNRIFWQKITKKCALYWYSLQSASFLLPQPHTFGYLLFTKINNNLIKFNLTVSFQITKQSVFLHLNFSNLKGCCQPYRLSYWSSPDLNFKFK